MDGSSAITTTGSTQVTTQNPQDIGAPTTLVPSTSTLQAGAASTTVNNLNTSTTTQGVPLSTISTNSSTAAPVFQPKTSYTPYLIGLGLTIIAFAVIGLVASNIVSNRRLAID